jgi:hypothetical protein
MAAWQTSFGWSATGLQRRQVELWNYVVELRR